MPKEPLDLLGLARGDWRLATKPKHFGKRKRGGHDGYGTRLSLYDDRFAVGQLVRLLGQEAEKRT